MRLREGRFFLLSFGAMSDEGKTPKPPKTPKPAAAKERKKPKAVTDRGPLDMDAPPVLLYLKDKGVRDLVHCEEAEAHIGQEEGYIYHRMTLMPGVNFLENDEKLDGDVGVRASIWKKLMETNEVAIRWVKTGIVVVIEDFTELPMELAMKYVLGTGRVDDLLHLKEIEERDDVIEAIEDELEALKKSDDKKSSQKLAKRRMGRRENFN